MADSEMQKLIKRINDLAHKAKEEELSEVEKIERKDLRAK